MALSSNEDIYEYHFEELYKLVKSLIGKSAIKEEGEDELNIPTSKLLFDVGGVDFNAFKAYETEYRCWVEVHVLKIIENILSRKGIWFEEHYYGDGTEQNSILLSPNGTRVEAFFFLIFLTRMPIILITIKWLMP